MSVFVPLQQSRKRPRLFHRVKIGPLQILDQRDLVDIAIGDDGEDGLFPEKLMGTEAPLTGGNDVSAAGCLLDQDRLLETHAVDRVRETAEIFLVEVLAWLVGIAVDRFQIDLDYPRKVGACSEQ